ncbi:alpha/beta hydrolase [Lutibacter sp.]|uniref:alpha/beta hydrolase n=1 Tax=Lutibacter sp. TaxID=1925666 RepID=UPI0035665925
MKKFLAVTLFLSFTLSIFSQDIKVKKFNSKELNNDRYLKIYVPPSYATETTKLYPVAIVLDAEYLFDVYVGNSILFANKDEAPEQIIIGINQNYNDERYSDCSYQKDNSLPTEEGAKFYRFIKSEIFSFIEENYRVSPFKTIVGSTLTANFINYFLIEDYPSFNAFITINPYFALDMPLLIQQKAQRLKDENVYYYLSNGKSNLEKYQALINQTNTLLQGTENPKLKYKYEAFNNNTTATIGQSIASALASIFEMYSAISTEEYEKNIKNMSPADAIAYLENKYVEIEYLFGSNLKIRQKDIFAIEPIILDKENGDYLKNFGEMINKLYADSPIGDYYIGRYYETGKKYKAALKYYKNGYMKLPEGDPNADAYYENVERVLNKRDGVIEDEPLDETKEKQ